MAVSRRSRYDPGPEPGRFVVTPLREAPLRLLGQFGLLLMPQLVALLPHQSNKGVQRTMLDLFMARYVTLVPVTRADLEGRIAPELLSGSAPNVYRLSAKGLRHLGIGPPPGWRAASPYRVAHELFVRQMLVWAHMASAFHRLELPEISVTVEPMGSVQPDALTIFRLPQSKVLVGLMEADRGTERGEKRWKAKIEGYAALFASDQLERFTGYKGARVLTVAHTPERAETLAALVVRLRPEEAFRYWFTDRGTLKESDLTLTVWRNQGELKPLLTPELLRPDEPTADRKG